LSRTWQMLLKGIAEVEGSNRPMQAAEMLLIRLAHAADLPTLDEALKSLEEGGAPAGSASRQDGPRGNPGNGGAATVRTVDAVASPRGPVTASGGATMRLVEPVAREQADSQPSPAAEDIVPAVPVTSIEDIVALADKHRNMQFKIMVKNCVRLVSIKPGRLEINLTEGAPKALLTDLAQNLNEWTATRWMVSLSREQGNATLGEAESAKRDMAISDARSDPDVMAILSKFPGAKIINVRIATPAGQGDDGMAGETGADDTLAPVEEDD
ncbi:MAG: DNA polymerase III subunit gamma/tau, partial [Alphaproteobacteria bacterium]